MNDQNKLYLELGANDKLTPVIEKILKDSEKLQQNFDNFKKITIKDIALKADGSLSAIKKQIQDSIPTSLDVPETARAADVVNGIVSGLSSAAVGGSSQPIILQVTLDSRVIAQTIFDPLRSVAVQRGVAYG